MQLIFFMISCNEENSMNDKNNDFKITNTTNKNKISYSEESKININDIMHYRSQTNQFSAEKMHFSQFTLQ